MKNVIRKLFNNKKVEEVCPSRFDIEAAINHAIDFGRDVNENFDFSNESIKIMEEKIIQKQYEDVDFSEPTDRQIWLYASTMGMYFGETLLRNGLRDAGFEWFEAEDITVYHGEYFIEPFLYNAETTKGIRPIDKVYKRLAIGGTFSQNLVVYYFGMLEKYSNNTIKNKMDLENLVVREK